MNEIVIIGGDARSCYLAKYLYANMRDVICIDVPNFECSKTLDDIPATGVAILPIPVSKDGIYLNHQKGNIKITTLCEKLKDYNFICGGIIPPEFKEQFYPEQLYDFMKDDNLARKNAIATAEGAIFDAFSLSDKNISGSKCLVTGFGRCSKVLCKKLTALDAHVIVAARSPAARSDAENQGYKAVSFDFSKYTEAAIDKVDFCFNTVPAMVLDKSNLIHFSRNVIIIDIASRPGGTDFDFCKKYDIKYKLSLGIPGKYCPDTSGKILADTLLLKGI